MSGSKSGFPGALGGAPEVVEMDNAHAAVIDRVVRRRVEVGEQQLFRKGAVDVADVVVVVPPADKNGHLEAVQDLGRDLEAGTGALVERHVFGAVVAEFDRRVVVHNVAGYENGVEDARERVEEVARRRQVGHRIAHRGGVAGVAFDAVFGKVDVVGDVWVRHDRVVEPASPSGRRGRA